jgi:3-oxoadipate enol-lactonase
LASSGKPLMHQSEHSLVPFTDNHGARLHWEERGEGTPVLLIMGHRYSSAMWYPILSALTAEHRVVWFDNRGTGESATTPKVTVRELAADALAVLDAAGVERAHVFGVSMGGVIAIEAALQQPHRVTSLIVGCSGVLSTDKPHAPAFLRLLYYLPPWALRLLTPNRTGDQGYGSAASPDRIVADQAMLAKDKSSARGVAAQFVAMGGYSTSTQAVSTLTMPALVLHGDEDALVPYQWGVELAETLPDSRLVTLRGSGHNFLVAAGERSSKAALDFIWEVDQGAAAVSG